MKTNSMVTITRGDKQIVIYVDEAAWYELPCLDFIVDVEIYHVIPEENENAPSNH